MDVELLVVTILKALAELAGMFLLGQGALYVLAGRHRDQNLFYQLLKVLTGPVVRLARYLTPKVVVDRHVPIVAFLIVFWLWVLLTFAKIQICATSEQRCRPDALAGAPAVQAAAAAAAPEGNRL